MQAVRWRVQTTEWGTPVAQSCFTSGATIISCFVCLLMLNWKMFWCFWFWLVILLVTLSEIFSSNWGCPTISHQLKYSGTYSGDADVTMHHHFQDRETRTETFYEQFPDVVTEITDFLQWHGFATESHLRTCTGYSMKMSLLHVHVLV